MLIHVDVVNWCANKFGEHHQAINAYVKQARDSGVSVVGVTYDSTFNNCRQMDFAEVNDAFWWEESVKVEPAAQDFLFRKIKPSALKGAGSHVLTNHIADKAPEAILICGYYKDQCVLHTARDLATRYPDCSIYILDDLCRAIVDNSACDGIGKRFPNVSVITTASVLLVGGPAKPRKLRRGSAPRCVNERR